MKVSGYQLFWMISISSIILFSYVPIKLAAEHTFQDAWISIFLGGMIMMAITWIMLQVCNQNKDKTLVEFMKDLLGTFLGKTLVTFYFIHWFIQMSTITRGITEFQNLVLLHEMPMTIILLCMLFLIVYVMFKGGIIAISRCAEVIGPFFIFLYFIQLILSPQEMDLNRILPVFVDSGWGNILKGTLYSFNYMIDPSIILMLFFFAENKRTAARGIFWGTAVAMLWGLLTTLSLLFITGPNITAEMVVPVYSITKLVSILDFIQNIDALYITFWVLGAFIKLSVVLFILSYGLAEWTGYRNWKLIACVTVLVLMAFVIYSTYDIRIGYEFKTMYLIGFLYPMIYIFVPILLWVLGSIKHLRKLSSVK
ncbi:MULTISPECIES: GerAB/ArcD/ProY family transporter [Cytobacillus]|uniref:GerAB/ArcD/ProY family transporter n=1 Tax=Cytobacillus TaxID=2675230 RepID=UPI00203BEC3C|nr:endospore germination permease [Cytobacillus firmus]MCM3704648.1 spore germination protein [Cytobacillus firmus]